MAPIGTLFEMHHSSSPFRAFSEPSVAAISCLDLLLVTSKNEGIPNVILEAFITKTPVVSVDVGGIPELIQNDQTGKLSSRDSVELAEKAIQLLSNSTLSKSLAKNAYDKALEFNNQTGIDQTLRLYEEILIDN